MAPRKPYASQGLLQQAESRTLLRNTSNGQHAQWRLSIKETRKNSPLLGIEIWASALKPGQDDRRKEPKDNIPPPHFTVCLVPKSRHQDQFHPRHCTTISEEQSNFFGVREASATLPILEAPLSGARLSAEQVREHLTQLVNNKTISTRTALAARAFSFHIEKEWQRGKGLEEVNPRELQATVATASAADGRLRGAAQSRRPKS